MTAPDRSPSGDLQVRRTTGADREAVLRLLARSLGREADPRYEALFAWKHEENAFGPSPAWVAVDGDRLAGFRVLMRWEFVEQGRVVHAVRAVDTATDPDYQGRGIFTQLALHALDELRPETDFVFNTPNDQSRPGYLKMGWQVVGRLPTAVRPTGLRGIPRIATGARPRGALVGTEHRRRRRDRAPRRRVIPRTAPRVASRASRAPHPPEPRIPAVALRDSTPRLSGDRGAGRCPRRHRVLPHPAPRQGS